MSNIDPAEWGPKYWYVMNSVAETYDINKKEPAINFFKSLAFLLPCESCKKHYSELLIKFPIENVLNSKEELINWVKKIRNEISQTRMFEMQLHNLRKLQHNPKVQPARNPNQHKKHPVPKSKKAIHVNKSVSSNTAARNSKNRKGCSHCGGNKK